MSAIQHKKASKILLLASDYPPRFSGGISNVHFNLSKHDKNRILKVIVPNTSAARQFDVEHGLDTFRVWAPSKNGIMNRLAQITLLFIAAIIESLFFNIKAVWCGHIYLTPIAYLMKRFMGIPYFLFMYGGEEAVYLDTRLKAFIFKHLVNNADVLFGCSEFTKKEMEIHWGYDKSIYVVNPGVEVERFYPVESSIASNNMNERDFVLLTIGTLVKRKGHDKVIEAISKLRPEIPTVRYKIIGTGPEHERLHHLANDTYDVGPHVEFLGFLDDSELNIHLNDADVFIMPSRITEGNRGVEGFGIVFLEANACGKPVIGGNSGGVSDAVLDGETGLLVDPEDAEDIKRAILFLYNKPDERKRMGKNGRERVLNYFKWDAITDKFVEIILRELDHA